MKPKTLFFILLLAAVAAGGWYLGRHGTQAPVTAKSGERKILFYQSPMHPWIKSEKPGNCTICGMKLAPVFEGDTPLEAASGSAVRLGPTSVNVLNVQSTEVRQKPLHRVIRVAGTIDDDDTRHRRLSAYVDGRIDKLGVRYVGAPVREGDLLAQLYSPALLAARDEYILLNRQPASPQRERMLTAAGEKLQRMGLAPEQIRSLPNQKELPNYLEILAPMSGTVVTRGVYEGQYVKEGDVLFEIGDFSKMWFVFNAYEQDLPWIKEGQMVEISSPLLPGKKYRAPIDFIDPNLDPATRSAKVRVILDNPLVGDGEQQRRELLHKVYADGIIEVDTPPVLTVPRSAVLSPGGQPLVYVVEAEGSYEPRPVTLGRVGDQVWEILDGLKEGEQVVTTGNLLIDAQAQLDHGGSLHHHDEPKQSETDAASAEMPHEALTDPQRTSADELLTLADELAAGLAADDLKRFNENVDKLHPLAAKLKEAFGTTAEPIATSAHLNRASDLASARKEFYPFSKATAQFAMALRQHDQQAFSKVHVYECPMVKDAVPSAVEKKGRWVQLTSELRNPFFGAEMLECGVEVKR